MANRFRPARGTDRTRLALVPCNPVVAGLAAAVFLTLVVGTVTSTLFALGEFAAKIAAEASAEDERKAKDAATQARMRPTQKLC